MTDLPDCCPLCAESLPDACHTAGVTVFRSFPIITCPSMPDDSILIYHPSNDPARPSLGLIRWDP